MELKNYEINNMLKYYTNIDDINYIKSKIENNTTNTTITSVSRIFKKFWSKLTDNEKINRINEFYKKDTDKELINNILKNPKCVKYDSKKGEIISIKI